jgi:hypothetical protein
MYILIKDSIPSGFAILAAAHGSLACYLKIRKTPEIAEWLAGPFRKVICQVSDQEFDAAKSYASPSINTRSLSWHANIIMPPHDKLLNLPKTQVLGIYGFFTYLIVTPWMNESKCYVKHEPFLRMLHFPTIGTILNNNI